LAQNLDDFLAVMLGNHPELERSFPDDRIPRAANNFKKAGLTCSIRPSSTRLTTIARGL